MTLALPERTAPAARPAGALSLGHMTPHEAWLFCESLANTPLLPDAYRKNPASVLWAMEYGRALGLDVVTTITTIHVIKGKPTQSADLMLSRARSAGHRVRVKSERDRCTVTITRADYPDDVYEIEWTLDDAVTAGLCTLRDGRPYSRDDKNRPQSWEKYPRAMLRARAIAECVRMACPEVLHGAIYTPEELGAVVDQEGNAVAVEDRAAPEVISHTVQQAPAAAQPGPTRDYLAEAREAATADDALDVYRAAEAAGAPADYLANLAAIGREKRAAEQQTEQPPAAEQQTNGAASGASPQGEHAAALGEMYDAAREAGLDRTEADQAFTAAHSCAPADATPEQLRSQRDDLLDAARGDSK